MSIDALNQSYTNILTIDGLNTTNNSTIYIDGVNINDIYAPYTGANNNIQLGNFFVLVI